MINYSIVIPHKNTPDLLQYCLDSIPVRDDIQVIVVDDNSDAEKVDFGRFPRWEGKNYECFLTTEGKGAGYARNVGLKNAFGKWVLFVDADDFLLPVANDIFDEEKDTNADIVFFRPKAVMLEDRVTYSKRADFYNAIIDKYFQTGDELELRCRWLSPCSKIYKLKLIKDKGIYFDEIRYSNDNLFSVKSGVCAGKILVRDKSYLCITESGRSLTSDFMKKPGELQIRADAFFRAQMILHTHFYPVDEESALSFLKRLFSEDRESFVLNFNRMRKIGYKKSWLIHEVFDGNSRKARIKRSIYTFLATGI